MSRPATIYFDESGFTGNNLLNPHQTIFSYGSILAEADEARDFVDALVKRYNVQNGELKGANLLKFNKGRRAISDVLRHFEGRMKVAVLEKKYALAGKFFEYIFEPPLQKNNFLFYKIDFHKFISNILYVEFMARGAGAEQIFADFERLMRSGSFEGLESLFSATTHPEISPVLGQIRDFAILNRAAITEELSGYAGEGSGKWILDLTNTALFSLLGQWGKDFGPLTAVCDQSKPLQVDQELFDVMIGRTDRKYSLLGDEESPITFNLSGPIQLVDSKTTPGVQLADCVAAAFAVACDRRSKDDAALEWRHYLEDALIPGCVFADQEHVDLNKLSAQRNAVVLFELLERSRRGENLLVGMPQFVDWITERLELQPISMKP